MNLKPALFMMLFSLYVILLDLCLFSSAVQAKTKVGQITTEELQTYPERFYVYEVIKDHYLVYRNTLDQEIEIEDLFLWGRIEGLHTQGYDGNSAERSKEWNLLNVSLHSRRSNVEFSSSLKVIHPPPPELKVDTHSTKIQAHPEEPPKAKQYGPRPSPTIHMECPKYLRIKDEYNLKLLTPEETKVLLKKARIISTPHLTFSAYSLLRDDWGVYYYIEQNKDPYKINDFRLWVGYRGAMKRVPVITAAYDSKGIVLVSKDSAIRLVSKGATSNQACEELGAYWVSKQQGAEQRKELLNIPIRENQFIIYNELGIYDHLYMARMCDPLKGRLMPRLNHPEEFPSPDLIQYDPNYLGQENP